MRTEIEDRLEAVLASAATAAPEPGTDFISAVRGRMRRHRRRRIASSVCGVAALLVAGLLVPVALPAGERGAPPRPDLVHLRPPEQVWPQAVVQLPPRLPDGQRYVILHALGNKSYLVRSIYTWNYVPGLGDEPGYGSLSKTQGKTDAIEILDAATGLTARVASVPEDADVWASRTAIVWITRRQNLDIWAQQIGVRTGAVHLARYALVNYGPTSLAILPDRVVFEAPTKDPAATAGLVSVPLTGGTPRPVPGSDGYAVGWDPDASGAPNRTWAVRISPPPNGAYQLWNLATGERLTIRPSRFVLECSRSWCLTDTGVLHPDGTDAVLVPQMGELHRPGACSSRSYRPGPPYPTCIPVVDQTSTARLAYGGTVAGEYRHYRYDDEDHFTQVSYLWQISTGKAAAIAGWPNPGDIDTAGDIIELDWDSTPGIGPRHRILDLTALG